MRLYKKKYKSDNNSRKRPVKDNPAVFSYYARGGSNTDQNTGRTDISAAGASAGYRPRWGHIPSYIALLAIVVALGYSCLLTPTAKVILTNTPNTVHREPKIYQEAVESIWRKSILNRTKLTVSTANISNDISRQFTELDSVKIDLPLLGKRPTVILTAVKPTLQLVSANGSFYVNANGKVMARSTDLTQNDLEELPVVRDDSGITAEPGKNIIPANQAMFLQSLYAQLKAQNLKTQSVTLPSKSANQVDVVIVGQPYYIKFSTDSDPRQAVGTYLAVKAKLDREGTTPREYMDVRVDVKVFYK